jgi:hypothetical protein
MRDYLRRYLDVRIAFAAAEINEKDRADANRRSGALQRKMWGLAVAQVAHDKRSTRLPLFYLHPRYWALASAAPTTAEALR